MTKFTGPIEAAAAELTAALDRAAEHLETCAAHPVVSDEGLRSAAEAARELAAEIGSKSGGDERLDLLLRVLAEMRL